MPLQLLFICCFSTVPHSLDQNICCCNVHMSSDSYNYLNLPCSVPVPPFVFVLQRRLPIWEQISFHAEFADVLKKKGAHLLKAREWHSSYVSFNSSAVSWITAHRHFKFIVSTKTWGVDFFRTCSPVSGRDICRLKGSMQGEEQNVCYFLHPKGIQRPGCKNQTYSN